MNPINESKLVFAQIRKTCRRPRFIHIIKQPQPLEGGDAVEDPPVGGLEAVREAEEEAGEGEEEKEDERQGPGDGVAGAVVGEDRRQELEGQERAGGEEVGEVGGGS